jgi:hypothetical protein
LSAYPPGPPEPPQYPPQYQPPQFQPPYQPPYVAPYQPAYGPPPPYFNYQPPAPRPGCVPLRPLNVSEILDGSFQVIRRNPRTTLGLSAVVAVVSAALTVGFQLWLSNIGPADQNNASAAFADASGQVSAGFSLLVLSTFLGAILTGMLAAVVTEDVIGIRLTIGQAWQRARSRIWSLFGLAVVTTFLELLGLLPCLVIGVWLWGIWAVAVPAMMVEGTTIRGSLRRSKQLVDGLFWRVWGIRALGAVLVGFVSAIISGPFEVLGFLVSGFSLGDSHLPASFILITAVGSIIATTVTAPVRAAIDALLYVDLRMRKEGLDLVLQQRAVGRG